MSNDDLELREPARATTNQSSNDTLPNRDIEEKLKPEDVDNMNIAATGTSSSNSNSNLDENAKSEDVVVSDDEFQEGGPDGVRAVIGAFLVTYVFFVFLAS